MKLVFFSNYLNHHQVVLADAFYEILGDDYRFVATCPSNPDEMKGGSNFRDRSYCLWTGDRDVDNVEAVRLAIEAEICVFGACSQSYAVIRAKSNYNALSFEMGERWLKKGWVNLFSPVLLKWLVNYWRYYRKANFHKLCMSAFAARDDERLNSYAGRHYKWGYFTYSNSHEGGHRLFANQEVSILWCARFLGWKHPELAVQLANCLKRSNIPFHLNMIGTGQELESTKALVNRLDLSDKVSFLGNVSNSEVRKRMSQTDIVIFTSDKNEGWGVVANEAMSEGCVFIGSDEIGSVPFLVKDGVNGLIFRSNSIDSLEGKVMQVMADKESAKRMAAEGKRTLEEVWSAKNAAVSLLRLIDDLNSEGSSSLEDGPCSKA